MIVLVIGGFYLVPQLKGAGLALNVVTGSPYWVGVVVVGAIVAINVAIGGMRGITYVQAFQFWVKVFAISVPICILLIHFGGLPERAALFGRELPHAGSSRLHRAPRQSATRAVPGRRNASSSAAARVHVAGGAVRDAACQRGRSDPARRGRAGRQRHHAQSAAGSGRARSAAPAASSPLLVYSLLLATFLGTMGLPHILVRFYTNPDGHAARRTTVRVLGLLSLFYLFPAFYGMLGRVLAPQLYVTGQTDDVVLTLPRIAWPGTVGTLLTAITCAGAFAAFLSTSSGLLVSLAGTLSHDVWPRVRHRVPSGVAFRRRHFRVAAVGGDGDPGAAGAGRRAGRYLAARRLGVRDRRQHLLPDVPARDLVDAADRSRRGGRDVVGHAGRNRRDLHRAGARRADRRRRGAARSSPRSCRCRWRSWR